MDKHQSGATAKVSGANAWSCLLFAAELTLGWWVILLGPSPTRLLLAPIRGDSGSAEFWPASLVAVGILFFLMWMAVIGLRRVVLRIYWQGIVGLALSLPWIGGTALWTGYVFVGALFDGELMSFFTASNLVSTFAIGLGGTAAALFSMWGPIIVSGVVVSVIALRGMVHRTSFAAPKRVGA